MKMVKKVLATFAAVAVSLGLASASMVEAQPQPKKSYRTYRLVKKHPRHNRRIKHRRFKKHHRKAHYRKFKKHPRRWHKGPGGHKRRSHVLKYRYPKHFDPKRLTTKKAL